MIASTDATQYAAGLLAATGDDNAEAVANQLSALAQAVGSHEALQAAFRDSSIPASDKIRLTTAIAEQAGASKVVVRFVGILAENGHATEMAVVATAYRRALDERNGVVEAVVRIAVPASEAELTQIAAALGRVTGSRVRIRSEIDPSVLGGFVARVGDLVYDGSIARQLERLSTTLRGV